MKLVIDIPNTMLADAVWVEFTGLYRCPGADEDVASVLIKKFTKGEDAARPWEFDFELMLAKFSVEE